MLTAIGCQVIENSKPSIFIFPPFASWIVRIVWWRMGIMGNQRSVFSKCRKDSQNTPDRIRREEDFAWWSRQPHYWIFCALNFPSQGMWRAQWIPGRFGVWTYCETWNRWSHRVFSSSIFVGKILASYLILYRPVDRYKLFAWLFDIEGKKWKTLRRGLLRSVVCAAPDFARWKHNEVITILMQIRVESCIYITLSSPSVLKWNRRDEKLKTQPRVYS